MSTLNEVFSRLSVRRRYEVWFVRLGLADGSGAWWFRYLLMNPGRNGCEGNSQGMPAQVWVTWFPRDANPRSFIQGFALQDSEISGKGRSPFYFRVAGNHIEDNFCQGHLEVEGHAITWNLRYASTFHATLSDKGWIGFSRTPHSDAVFSGEIALDGRKFTGSPVGFGVQGHNCGYRHRNFWTWAHAYFPHPERPASTLEALVYEMPFGLFFRKAVLWHDGEQYVFRSLQETCRTRENLQWDFRCTAKSGLVLDVRIDGSGSAAHHLPYLRTNCTGTFEVANNSLARASIEVHGIGGSATSLATDSGAVLEMVG